METDPIAELIADLRARARAAISEEATDALNASADTLEVEHQRAERAEGLLDKVAGVAASSIPDLSLRGKPMAAVVGLSVTLGAAEVERDALRAALKEVRVWLEGHDLGRLGFSHSDLSDILSRAIDTKEEKP